MSMWSKLAFSGSVGLLFFLLMYSVSCPKDPIPFDVVDAGDNGGVVDEQDEKCVQKLLKCEAELEDALNDGALWREMAENCIDLKVSVSNNRR